MITKSVDPVIYNLYSTMPQRGDSGALERLHEGNSNLKTSNLTILKSKTDLFVMTNGETHIMYMSSYLFTCFFKETLYEKMYDNKDGQ